MRRTLIVLAAMAMLFPPTAIIGPARAGSPPPATGRSLAAPPIRLELVLAGLDQPLYVTGARDGSNRLFIAERPGRIQVLQPGAGAPTVFLDINERVAEPEGEDGLLGLAFHPQYMENGRFFVSYSRVTDGATVVAEYHASPADPNAAEPDERQLLVIPQPTSIHHSGMLAFGPDQLLYLSVGDGGPQRNPDNSAQDLNSLRGKILRIDVDQSDGDLPYAAPVSNPFFGDATGRDEIYALGLRNPWRFSFDRATGQLYVGDVGLDTTEEINLVTLGGNYGWRVREGSRCTTIDPETCDTLRSVPPLIEYAHASGRCSVTGGHVYRGTAASLPEGTYLFADFCSGEIFSWDGSAVELLLSSELNIASFGEDDGGEIYVVGLGGSVHRIVADSTPLNIDSVQVRKRSNGVGLDPVTVRPNGKKFEVVVRGEGFAEGATIIVGGRELKTLPGATAGAELIARLRGQMLAQPGQLIVEVGNPDGSRSTPFAVPIGQ